MPVFMLQVAWRSVASVFVEANNEADAVQMFEETNHLPDADEIEREPILTVVAVTSERLYSSGEVIRRS